ncbi:AAA family ATPase [Methanosarcina sp. T3]|uniref:AAA family ATPase n=1 Tax=Methanosarcina sp. T3 TaxID=3439062 RepID=UPI003F82BA6B
MLKKIILKNFKAFRNAEIELKPITILVGPNSGGKTSILNSIRLMKQTFGCGTSDVLNFKGTLDFGSFDSIVNQNFENGEVGFNIEFGDNTYFDVRIAKCPFSGKIYIKYFSSSNGEFEYIADGIKKALSKKEHDVYISNDFRFTSVNENNLFEGINPRLYRKNFFYIIENFFDNEEKESLFSEVCDQYYRNDNSPKLSQEEVRYYFNKILNLYSKINEDSVRFYENVRLEFENIKFIGPIRPTAFRAYDFKQTDEISCIDENEIQTIANNSTLQNEVLNILENLELAYKIKVTNNAITGTFIFELITHKKELEVNFADVGFGISQILPIIVQSLLADKDTMIAVEQPEVHLHPRVQAYLGNFFVQSVKNGNGKYLIETHSDYLIERIRYCVADKKISSDDIIIYYIEYEETQHASLASKIEINSDGQYLNLPDNYITNFRLEESRDMAGKILENLSGIK